MSEAAGGHERGRGSSRLALCTLTGTFCSRLAACVAVSRAYCLFSSIADDSLPCLYGGWVEGGDGREEKERNGRCTPWPKQRPAILDRWLENRPLDLYQMHPELEAKDGVSNSSHR